MPEQLLVSIIDDDADIRRALATMFSDSGYAVECFASAEQFLDQIENLRVSVIVSDMQMAGMSGIEMYRALRARDVNIPAILITAFATDVVLARAAKAGIRKVLEKPFNPATLLLEVEAASAGRDVS